MRSDGTIQALCRGVLTSVVDYYVDNDLPLPERRHICAGPPEWPCEAVAVWVERTAGHEGDITREVATPLVGSVGSTLRTLTLDVTITRCTPDIIDDDGSFGGREKLPTVAEVEQGAADVHADEVRVIEAIRLGAEMGRLPDLNDWAMLDWKVVGPLGGFVASELRLKVSTDWLPPAEGS